MPSRSGIGKLKGAHYKGAGWYGNGELGDAVISRNTSIPVEEDSGQLITQYRNLTINANCTLQPSSRCNGWILLVQGDLTVNGTINMDKKAPCQNSNEALALQEKHVALVRGNNVGGNAGATGIGSQGHVDAWGRGGHSEINNGGRPGNGFYFGGGFGPGGGSNSYRQYTKGGNGEPRPQAGSLPYVVATSYQDVVARGYGPFGGNLGTNYGYFLPGQSGSGCAETWYYYGQQAFARGGNGPGGSGTCIFSTYDSSTSYRREYGVNGNNGDAYGGGALFIFVGGRLVIGSGGKISANGGNGGNSGYLTVEDPDDEDATIGAITQPGGGGGGGLVFIIYANEAPQYQTGSIQVNGGIGGKISGGMRYLQNFVSAGHDGYPGKIIISHILDYFD